MLPFWRPLHREWGEWEWQVGRCHMSSVTWLPDTDEAGICLPHMQKVC